VACGVSAVEIGCDNVFVDSGNEETFGEMELNFVEMNRPD
jgi:hypothetical protein